MAMISEETRCWVLRNNSATPADRTPTTYDMTDQHHPDQEAAHATLRRLIDQYPWYFTTFTTVALDHRCRSMTCDICGNALGQEEEGVTFHYASGAEAEQFATAWGWGTNGHLWLCGPCCEEQPISPGGPVTVSPDQLPLDLAG